MARTPDGWNREEERARVPPLKETGWMKFCLRHGVVRIWRWRIRWVDVSTFYGRRPRFGKMPAGKRYGLEIHYCWRRIYTTWPKGDADR